MSDPAGDDSETPVAYDTFSINRGLSTQEKADVNAEADSALSDVGLDGVAADVDTLLVDVAANQSDLDTIIAFLHQVMVMFPNHQHLNANAQITVDGDTAAGRVMCFNPQEMSMPDGKTHIFMCGVWYID